MFLVADHVSYRYGTAEWLYEDFSLECSPGNMVGLAGPSGSGKSTLLDLLGMTFRPNKGQINLWDEKGRAIARSDASNTAITPGTFSWILQSNTVLSGRTALDNVAIAHLAAGGSERDARQRASDALTRVGMERHRNALVNTLSGGEIQRVTIARCLLSPARVVLADEPTGQLDSLNTQLVANSLRHLAAAGRIVVVATHDDQVLAHCDELVRLR